MELPFGTRFIVPRLGAHKYMAVIPTGHGTTEKVRFGDPRYQQYKDSVPKKLGGGKWSHLDHLDKKRRESYLARASGQMCGTKRCVDIPYTPAWFSYHYLW